MHWECGHPGRHGRILSVLTHSLVMVPRGGAAPVMSADFGIKVLAPLFGNIIGTSMHPNPGFQPPSDPQPPTPPSAQLSSRKRCPPSPRWQAPRDVVHAGLTPWLQ